MNTANIKKLIVRPFIYLMLALLTVQSLYPVVWIVIGSLNPGNSLFSTRMIPENLTLVHYTELFTKRQFGLWYVNTLKIACATTVLAVVFVIVTAYVLSQFRFKGRKAALMAMLVLQMFPAFMSLVAVFVLLNVIGLLDTHLGLILVYAGGAIPGGAWLVKGYFDGIPRSLPEAARIDGASNSMIFTKIMMPLAVPILTFIAITNFIAPWMDFVLARLILRSAANKTLAIGLFELVNNGLSATHFTTFAAGAVLVAIPITILYMCFQKYLIQGLAEGASKG